MLIVDWIIIPVIFIGLGIGGLLCRKYENGVSDFVVAGRHVLKYLGLSTGIMRSLELKS